MVFKKAQSEAAATPKVKQNESAPVKVELVAGDANAISSGEAPVEVEESPELTAMKEQYADNWSAEDLQDRLRQARALKDQALLRKYGEEAAARLTGDERARFLNSVVLDNQLTREASVLDAAGIEVVSPLTGKELPEVSEVK